MRRLKQYIRPNKQSAILGAPYNKRQYLIFSSFITKNVITSCFLWSMPLQTGSLHCFHCVHSGPASSLLIGCAINRHIADWLNITFPCYLCTEHHLQMINPPMVDGIAAQYFLAFNSDFSTNTTFQKKDCVLLALELRYWLWPSLDLSSEGAPHRSWRNMETPALWNGCLW